jgi:hypothetical protein
MKYLYPSTFSDYDSWVEYSEDLRRYWEASQTWRHCTPEQWILAFPEMKDRVSELYLEAEDLLSKLRADFIKTENLFSNDLNTRLLEEAYLDETLGKTIKQLETKVNNYKRMLAVLNPVKERDVVTDQDIRTAREYLIADLLPELPRRGFIHCPFHSEKTPSCKVFPSHIYCFGCGKHIDSIGLLMEVQGKTFIDSVKYLCQK